MKSKNLKKAMGIIIILISIFSSSAIILYGVEEAIAQEEHQTSAKRITALEQMIAVIEKLEQRSIDKNLLEKQIIDSPAKYKKRDKSKEILREKYEIRLKNELDAELSKISKAGWVTKEWLDMQRNTQFRGKIESAMETVLGEKFPKTFEKARELAVKKQWESVTLGIYPDQKDVETIEEKGERNQLEKKIAERMAGEITLLEENENRLEEAIDAVIDDALSQLQEQRNLVRNSKAKGTFTDTAIKTKLLEELNQYITEQKKANPNKYIYKDVFPSVRSEDIPKRAEELMKEKFQIYVSSNEICSFIDQNEIKSLIEGNPSEYYTFEQSLKKLQEKLIFNIRNKIVIKYSEKAGGNRDFQKKLKILLIKDNDIVRSVNDNVNEGLKEPVKKIREQLTERQLGYFPEIKSKGWEIPEEIILKYNQKGYVPTIDKLGKLLKIENIKEIKNSLLKESEDELNSIKKKLLEEGNRALCRQQGIVGNLGSEIQNIFQREIRNDPNYKKLNKDKRCKHYKSRVEKLYVRQTENIWKKNRIKLIWGDQEYRPYMEKKYSKLFNHTIDEIEKIITPDFFEEVEEPEIEKVEHSEEIEGESEGADGEGAGGEGTGGEGTGGEGTGGEGTGGEGTGGGGGGAGGVGEKIAKIIKSLFPWLLLLILLVLLILLIWWLLRRRKKKVKQVVCSGRIIFKTTDKSFYEELEYPKGETDSNKVKEALNNILKSLKE